MIDDPAKLIQQLESGISKLTQTPHFARLVPEVGGNFVACLSGAKELSQVAGLTGRIILVRGKPEAIGEVDFGWAPYMGRVILKAHALNESIHAAVSLRHSNEIVEAARQANLQVVGYRLGERTPIPECMTLEGLMKYGFVPEVLFDWGAHGVEPLVVVFGQAPKVVTQRVHAILGRLLADE
ncbi:MAG: thiamine-phosphate synthase family protein [Promethearchaeota archaeon]